MDTLEDSIVKGEAALEAIYALQTAAMKAGDLATQKALEDDIDELTYKLTQLTSLAIAVTGTQIDTLNNQLDAVTTTAQIALNNITQVTNVLNNIVTAAKILDTIIGVVAKA